MSIFISYSHQDRKFVDKLAAELVKAKNHVWVDRWELRVGDSLIQRIQEAIQDADALLVVLSKASVESEWCKKELSAGLIRELEERRVVVLPVLIETCDIPLFLRDKLYADFRTDDDDGLARVLESVAGVTSTTLGRIQEADSEIDWSVEWISTKGVVSALITIVERTPQYPYTILTDVRIEGSDVVQLGYQRFLEAGLIEFGEQHILEVLTSSDVCQMDILVTSSRRISRTAAVIDSKVGAKLEVEIGCRWLGEDMGRDVLIHVGQQIRRVITSIRSRLRKPTSEELSTIIRIIRTPS